MNQKENLKLLNHKSMICKTHFFENGECVYCAEPQFHKAICKKSKKEFERQFETTVVCSRCEL